jgi:hypothetical protein
VSFDCSRFTFDPWNDFLGVVMQEGRPQLDSEWNEWLAELARRIHAGTLDTVGRAGYPATTPNAFVIKTPPKTNHFTIGPGRMYVDGLLAENHGPTKDGQPTTKAQWDPALAELSGAPQIPSPVETDVDYTQQRYLPGATLPLVNGPFLVYLDVWQRAVTYLESPDIVEKALGIDTTGRLQTVWQVKLLDVSNVAGGVTCSTPDKNIPEWMNLISRSGGRLTTNVIQSTPSGPCCLTTSTGYTGMENQLYRVEIHQPGAPISNATGPVPLPLKEPGTATLKWSRDNASVATAVIAIAAVTVCSTASSRFTVQNTGKDNVLRFSSGDWVEITDDWLELGGQPGELRLVSGVDDAAKTVTVSPPVTSSKFPVDANGQTDTNRHTRLTRWDQKGKVFQSDGTTVWIDLSDPNSTGDIPVPPAGTILILENGITVTFNADPSGGPFVSGDFWCFAARTADGKIDLLTSAPPLGIHHHYARLSIVTLGADATDCRHMFPPLTKLTQLHYVSGDGQEAPPGTQLPQPLQAGVANGSFPVAGASVQFKVVSGNGTLTQQADSTSGATVTVPTGPDGVASCTWQVDTVNPSQRVEATLVTGEALPVRFNASFSGLTRDPGVHITAVSVFSAGAKVPLLNDSNVLLDAISGGIDIDCDQAIDSNSVTRPTCFVSIELPVLFTPNQVPSFPAFTLVDIGSGYQTIVLEADVGVDKNNPKSITWRPTALTLKLLRMIGPKELSGVRGILARLTLVGSFIWSSVDKSVYLDGDDFGVPGTGTSAGSTVLSLPSGDQRRGGTFTMWFWLALLKSVSITTPPTQGAPGTPPTFKPGQPLAGMVEVTSPPPGADGFTVNLATDPASTPAGTTFSPPSVVIKQGQVTTQFQVTTATKPATTKIVASLGSDSQACTVTTVASTG